jgi:hypothetical protein
MRRVWYHKTTASAPVKCAVVRLRGLMARQSARLITNPPILSVRCFDCVTSLTTFRQFVDNFLQLFDRFFCNFWQLLTIFLTVFGQLFQKCDNFFWQFLWLCITVTPVTPKVFKFIGPSNDSRRHGRGTYLFVLSLFSVITIIRGTWRSPRVL